MSLTLFFKIILLKLTRLMRQDEEVLENLGRGSSGVSGQHAHARRQTLGPERTVTSNRWQTRPAGHMRVD